MDTEYRGLYRDYNKYQESADPAAHVHHSKFYTKDALYSEVLAIHTRWSPSKRRAAIKYGDKKRVGRFREYATDEFVKRNLDGTLTELIGGLTLDTALRDRGRTERELDEGARCGKHFGGSAGGTRAQTTARCGGEYRLHLRFWTRLPMWRMEALSLRTGERTVGAGHRTRRDRWGNGPSDQAKHASAIYVRIRRMIGQVRGVAPRSGEPLLLN